MEVRSAVALVVASAPGSFAVHIATSLLLAAVPVASAWSAKFLVDGLIDRRSAGYLLTAGAVLAATGGGLAVLPGFSAYCVKEPNRSTRLAAHRRAAEVMNSFSGLAYFESPKHPAPVAGRRRGPAGGQGISTQWFSMNLPPLSRPPQTASLGYALISRLTMNRHRETPVLLPR